MSEATALTEAQKIEAAQNAVTEAESLLATAKAKATGEDALTALKAGNIEALGALTDAARKAEVVLEQRKAALGEMRKASVWESLMPVRQVMRDAFKASIVDAPPVASVTGMNATITLETAEDGKTRFARVTLRPVIGEVDLAEVSKAIAESIDIAAFDKEQVTSIDVSVTKIGSADAMITDLPSGPKSAAKPRTASSNGDAATRSGPITYLVNGEWIGAKALLQHVEGIKHQIATDRAQSFDTALRGNGNGLSNLAKQVAEKLNIESKAGDAA